MNFDGISGDENYGDFLWNVSDWGWTKTLLHTLNLSLEEKDTLAIEWPIFLKDVKAILLERALLGMTRVTIPRPVRYTGKLPQALLLLLSSWGTTRSIRCTLEYSDTRPHAITHLSFLVMDWSNARKV